MVTDNMMLNKAKIIDKQGNKYAIHVNFNYDVLETEIKVKDVEIVIVNEEGVEIDKYDYKNYKTIWEKYKEFEEVE